MTGCLLKLLTARNEQIEDTYRVIYSMLNDSLIKIACFHFLYQICIYETYAETENY